MHLADLHLDSPFVGMGKEYQSIQKALIQAAYTAFDRAVNVAINRQVDLVLIAGDVYDADKQTVTAQHSFMKALERLSQAEIPVCFIHGNHDFMTASLEKRIYPKGVYVLKEDHVSYVDINLKNGEIVRIYGFSYKSRWIADRMIDQYPVNPMQTDYTIGLLHGDLASGKDHSGNYAPFNLEDLIEKNYDYWALGHIHQAKVLHTSPLIQYSGTIQGRHRNEEGPKGGQIVDIQRGLPSRHEFIELSPVIWQSVNLECNFDFQATQLVEAINKIIDNYRLEAEGHERSYILSINLIHAERLDEELQEQIQQGQLIENLQTYFSGDIFVVVGHIKMHLSILDSAFEYDPNLNASFEEACHRMTQSTYYQAIMKPFNQHPTVQTYLTDLISDEQIQEEITQRARHLVIQSLGFDLDRKEDLDED